jgi:hypothetical protein
MKKTRASEKRRNQNISKNTAMELSSAPCGSGGNSYLSSRKEREGNDQGREDKYSLSGGLSGERQQTATMANICEDWLDSVSIRWGKDKRISRGARKN